jgi:large subunit ribosomal protein L29
MKTQQYREMSPDELAIKLEELEKHLFDLRSQSVTEKLENSRAVTNTRRDIAKIRTIMRERKQ